MNTPKIGRSKRAKASKGEPEFQEVANRCVVGIRGELDALAHAQECDGKCQTCGGVGDLGGEVNGSPEHCPDCTDGTCKRGTETEQRKGSDGKVYTVCLYDYPEAWHNEDAARSQIDQGPLSVQVRTGWYTPGEQGEPKEYCILLGTGGPASRIVGNLGMGNVPESARFQYQDWFKPWTDAQLTQEEEATLLEYAQHFYFG